MKIILIAITAALTILGTIQFMSKPEQSQSRFMSSAAKSPAEVAWMQWRMTHGKAYGVASDEAYRFEVFTQNYNDVNAHNAKHTAYKKGLNKFSDLSADEFKAQYLKYQHDSTLRKHLKKAPVSNLKNPSSVNWDLEDKVTWVKDQGQCGSCWAFSTTGALEGAYAMANNYLEAFSEQQFLDCSGNGCSGGNPIQALQYAEQNGVTTEEKYEYTGFDGSCSYTSADKVFQPSRSVIAEATDAGLEDAAAVQPVSVAINGDAIQSYTSGVFDDWTCSTQLDHAVLVVGYTADYWIVKNSWGYRWGEMGYIRMARGRSDGICGITTQPIYPVA